MYIGVKSQNRRRSKPSPARPSESPASRLRMAIHEGQFVSGQRLIEVEIMELLGVSRGQVRLAFRELESEGLVRIEKNRGASVRRISRAEVRESLDVLEVISLVLSEKAVERVENPEAEAALRRSLDLVTKFKSSRDRADQCRRYMNETARFWLAISNVVANSVLEDFRIKLETKLFRLSLEGLLVTGNAERWVALHGDILKAILARDAVSVRALVVRSVRDVSGAIHALPDSAFGT